MAALDATHDPARRSWVASANDPGGDFPIQNLPLAAFRRAGTREPLRGGVAIGTEVLDLGALNALKPFEGSAAQALAAATEPNLNALMGQGAAPRAALRGALSEALRTGSALEARLRPLLVPQSAVEYGLAAEVGDYTDFYASIHHATAVGRLFRPDNPLLPNYKWVPIAYHGRASSLRVSGHGVERPLGQVLAPGAQRPELIPTRRLDYELEVGVFIGRGNELGKSVPLAHAEEHVFGLCLLNDWSARDVQSWEYQPLGPFLAKNFLTTVSPWVVTLEALAPFRVPWTRPPGEPEPLAYLDDAEARRAGGFDLELEVWLDTARMRASGAAPLRLSHANFRDSWWTVSQMVAHHTVNGCNLRPGDLIGSGTQSGPKPEQAGSLLELSAGGKRPLALASGESRTFLEDGDRVAFRACCERAGFARIGFGELSGTVLAAATPGVAASAALTGRRA
ncbi:MAG TPA: fumarylacetoacetase [Steroidobacteraceae bacterium]|jgi:fumarylacetoacetase|nr:fumarylacetoacetase [Steroidobacteraceae bacterium]